MTDIQQETPQRNVLKIAIVSDIHAYDHLNDDKEAPSFLCTVAPENRVSHHPIAGLLKLIDDQSIRADILMCCGDMGDKARPAGILYTWDKLHVIKRKLEAKTLAVTAGNHDVDSRYKYTDYDAKGLLQSLVPPFPCEDEKLNDKFWARNYIVFSEPDYRLVILNTSAYHGAKEGEFEHGRITPRTVEALKAELEVLEHEQPRRVNILLCHHHPHNHGDIEDKDVSLMEGGAKLLELLGSGDYGNWIVIHGHKHHPRISYAAASISPPIVFSAGSLCARIYEELQGQARNQFYVITFPLSDLDTLELGLIGTFQAWDWLPGIGWQRATLRSGLPASGGFGNRGDITSISKTIATIFASKKQPWVEWNEIIGAFPQVSYLLPISLQAIIKKLESNYNLTVSRDSDGQPLQIGRSL
ncbi:MAG: hypothetical protein QOG71_3213 [Pyrinomonadaceae bacterium]|nr:hypothetical protein [Pyrinomonadaceae bacterium]